MGIILRIDWFRSDTMWLIEKLGLYLDSMEAAIAASRMDDRKRIDRLQINSQDDFDDRQEELYRHQLLFEKDFPSKLRYSFLVMLYIIFESRSKSLCKELNKRKIVEGKSYEKKGDESFTKALRRFFEAEPSKLTFIKTKVWTELSDFNGIRSCVVHGNGDVNTWNQRPRVMQIIKKNKANGLSLNEDGFIQIDVIYCRHILDVVKQFFHTVFEETHFGPEE